MANEAVILVETELPVNRTVANGTGIEKGALLVLSDPDTVAAHSGVNQQYGGIAYNEKIASDGITKLAVMKRCEAKVTLSGSCAVGDPLGLSATVNMVRSVAKLTDETLSGTRVCGYALETGTTGETIKADMFPSTQTSGTA